MSFKEGTRQFYFKVVDYECQYEQYTEKKGFQTCKAPVKHLHHIIGETETLQKGLDPERNIALPLCEKHHVRGINEDLGEPDSSFHPDIAQAFRGYKEWKQNELHMMSISGRRVVDYSTSPFAETGREHKQKAEHGERYINGDENTDNYYIEKMREKLVIYQAKTGERLPDTKPHPKTDPSKKEKRWYDWF
jgi:hypothetical protein